MSLGTKKSPRITPGARSLVPTGKGSVYFRNRIQLRVEFDGKSVYLGKVQQRVWKTFLKGGKYTGCDLCRECRITDPRGHIAALRGKGLPIAAIWVINPDTGSRCKRYFLDHEK